MNTFNSVSKLSWSQVTSSSAPRPFLLEVDMNIRKVCQHQCLGRRALLCLVSYLCDNVLHPMWTSVISSQQWRCPQSYSIPHQLVSLLSSLLQGPCNPRLSTAAYLWRLWGCRALLCIYLMFVFGKVVLKPSRSHTQMHKLFILWGKFAYTKLNMHTPTQKFYE